MVEPRLSSASRLALLMHGAVTHPSGKMGFGLMRYCRARTVAVIDRETAGQHLHELTGIACDAPIVATLGEALAYAPDTLVPAVAPPNGILPEAWMPEIREALKAGLNIVNGLHRRLADDPELAPHIQPDRWVWDMRQEPAGLENGMGRAAELPARRVLTVGTDMAIGKMTAAIEMDRAARAQGLRSRFLATGQIGIAIAGEGIPIDAVRVDFATGAAEALALRHGRDHDVLFIEGQGSLMHPASSAVLALMRGAMPTELILCHHAGHESLWRAPWVRIPPLAKVVELYEQVSAAAGSLPGARVAGIALNCSKLDEASARAEIARAESETGLPVTDVVRFGAHKLVDALQVARGS